MTVLSMNQVEQLISKAAAMDDGRVPSKNITQQSNSTRTGGERHQRCQIVNGRGGREMEEEIESSDHKGNNNVMALVAMASEEKGGGSNGVCHH